ncbi:hypothetical protein AVEN_21776-1 [Araneus ventricosus]|uniref:Uncharacterized protein n=1 Tax=Araneus ventricosus TaxID=182803 RepID=A0A4Y2NM06_ARAVE|nr:hypothetical protein AVEN_21776-1 [Araneus ventricosus]
MKRRVISSPVNKVLRTLSNTSCGADLSCLLRVYRSIIRSMIDYGSVVYGSARPSYLKRLDYVHHQALRLSLGASEHLLYPVYMRRLLNHHYHLEEINCLFLITFGFCQTTGILYVGHY